MLNEIPCLVLIKGLWAVAAGIIVGSGFLARLYSDGQWVNRGGALVAAMAAGAVVLQISIEIGLDRAKRNAESRPSGISGFDVDSALPLERLAMRIAQAQTRKVLESLERNRLLIAMRVVACAMVGELLHGFGDLIACNTFVMCRLH